ncbi:nicotinamide mononucleotide transporter family protein [Streptomyces sp. RKAG293]|uniref:nicotinamide mononucleotide transporter family protein n=1 Tax=Streptomyces sp. RKAG293 TaxID=2893403 RepID=UPI002033B29D|nr:nicotinamide mononucleotide transporter family protein [Streptomyces sp. RKAG293]MCM2418226.1 nicotinamide mononucleotide transporter family protein [Streptomyces sp. RKAG293]
MSALDWLNSEAFTAFDQHILWSDMAGNLLGLGALALGWRRSMLTWPVQLLSGLVLVAAYASAHLSGGIGKQIVVVTVAVWGWAQWRRGGATKGRLAIRFATWTERAWLVAGTAAGTVALALLFTAYPKLSWDPWPDAYIFVGTLTAMVAQARGWVEFWFAWLAVDVVGVPLAFNNGLAFSGLVYVIYFVLVVLGLRAWWLQTRTDRAPSGTVPDGATA